MLLLIKLLSIFLFGSPVRQTLGALAIGLPLRSVRGVEAVRTAARHGLHALAPLRIPRGVPLGVLRGSRRGTATGLATNAQATDPKESRAAGARADEHDAQTQYPKRQQEERCCGFWRHILGSEAREGALGRAGRLLHEGRGLLHSRRGLLHS